MKPRPHAELIKAWADGAEIEYYSESCEDWLVCDDAPMFLDGVRYRIRPQQKEETLYYLVSHYNGKNFPRFIAGYKGAKFTVDGTLSNLALSFDDEGKLKHAEVIK